MHTPKARQLWHSRSSGVNLLTEETPQRPRLRGLIRASQNLPCGLCVTVTSVVSTPSGEGDALVSQDGSRNRGHGLLPNDTHRLSFHLTDADVTCGLSSSGERERGILIKGLHKNLPPRFFTNPNPKPQFLPLQTANSVEHHPILVADQDTLYSSQGSLLCWCTAISYSSLLQGETTWLYRNCMSN